MQNKMNSFIFYAEVQPIFGFWAKIVQTYEISATFPILDEDLKQQLIDMLAIQLKDNRKAGWVDENLNNVLKRNPEEEPSSFKSA